MREFLKQYFNEKQNSYLQSGHLREVGMNGFINERSAK